MTDNGAGLIQFVNCDNGACFIQPVNCDNGACFIQPLTYVKYDRQGCKLNTTCELRQTLIQLENYNRQWCRFTTTCELRDA